MTKYSIELIQNYVDGEDIEGYDIEKLENDYIFMMSVINYTNDKNMYELCSDKVKNNYEFIKFMINKFKTNIAFICHIADEYLDNTEDELNRLELLIIMSNLIDKDDDHYLTYKIQLEGIYTVDKYNIETLKKEYNDKEYTSLIQAGFWFIIDTYHSSDIIMKYYAKRFIEDLIDEFNIDLEKIIHKEFTTFKELELYGINKYLINLISLYDSNLSAYITCHIELLNNLKKQLDRINHRWNHYFSIIESEKYYEIINTVHEYTQSHEECTISEIELLYYIGQELGIASIIAKYDGIDEEFYEEIIKSFNEESQISIAKQKNDLNDLKHYLYLKKLITTILTSGTSLLPQIDSNKKNKPKSNNKILKFIPRTIDVE